MHDAPGELVVREQVHQEPILHLSIFFKRHRTTCGVGPRTSRGAVFPVRRLREESSVPNARLEQCEKLSVVNLTGRDAADDLLGFFDLRIDLLSVEPTSCTAA